MLCAVLVGEHSASEACRIYNITHVFACRCVVEQVAIEVDPSTVAESVQKLKLGMFFYIPPFNTISSHFYKPTDLYIAEWWHYMQTGGSVIRIIAIKP